MVYKMGVAWVDNMVVAWVVDNMVAALVVDNMVVASVVDLGLEWVAE